MDYKEFPELSAFKNAVFEIGSESTNYKPEMKDITWSSAEIEEGPTKGKNYILVLKLKQRIEKLVVYPVLSGNDFADASKKYEEKFEKYKTLQAKRVADEAKLKAEMEAKQAAFMAQQQKIQEEYIKQKARLQKEAELAVTTQIKAGGVVPAITRVFSISNFGIFNSDHPCNLPSTSEEIQPMFVSNGAKEEIQPNTIYLIETNRNIVFTYGNGSRMKIDSKVPYSMCILVGPNVYIISKEEFSRAVSSKDNNFNVTKLGSEITDVYELKKAMGLI